MRGSGPSFMALLRSETFKFSFQNRMQQNGKKDSEPFMVGKPKATIKASSKT